MFADLKVPHRPLGWETDTSPTPFGVRNGASNEKQAQILTLINFYRVRGHLAKPGDPPALPGWQ
jgi:2-oxoglutarate dehydrogenase complex dehydrogenase (E1) component-like enzyme